MVAPPPPPPVPQPDPNRIYTMGDKDVTAPVVIRQDDAARSRPPMKLQAKERGVVEVVIDEQGRVTNVTIRESVHPMFDAELLTARASGGISRRRSTASPSATGR